MNYWLHYNDKLGTFRIDQVGKTLTTKQDDYMYLSIGGSNSLQELKSFVFVITLISLLNNQDQILNYDTVKHCFEKRFSKLVVRNFEGNDF